MRVYGVLLGVSLLSGSAWADTRSDVLNEVAKCADIAAAADRLKCFDAAVPHAQAALATPAPVQTTQTEGEGGGVLGWFGFERPVTKTEDFGKPPAPPKADGPKEITSLAANVSEFGRTPSGRALFILDNGQVWRQIDGDTTDVGDPSSNEQMKIAIEKAFFGSYALKIEGRTGLIKVRRVK